MITQLKHLKILQNKLEKVYQHYQDKLIENQNQLEKYQKIVTKKLSENTSLSEIPILTLEHLKNRFILNQNFKSLPHTSVICNLSGYQCIIDQITFSQIDFFWFWSLVSDNLDLNPISSHIIHQYLDIYFLKNYTYDNFKNINKPTLKSWNSNFKSFQIKIHHLRQELQIQKNYESANRKEKLKNCQLERDFWLRVLKSNHSGINQLYPEKISEWLENVKEDQNKLNFKKSEDVEKLMKLWIQKKELACEIKIFPQVLENLKIKIEELQPEIKKIEQYLIHQKQNKIQLRNESIINLKKQCKSEDSDDQKIQNIKYWEKQIQEKEYILKLKLQKIKNLKKSNTQIDEKIDSYHIETYSKNHLLHNRLHKIISDLQNTKNLNLEKIKTLVENQTDLDKQIQKFKNYLIEISLPENTHFAIKKELDIGENNNSSHLLKLQTKMLDLSQLESSYHQEHLDNQKNLAKLDNTYLTFRNKFMDENESVWIELEKKKHILHKIQQLEKQLDTYSYLEEHYLEKKVIEYQTHLQNITSQFNLELDLENKHPDASKISSEIQKNIIRILHLYFWILVSEDLNIFIDWDTWNTKHNQYFLNLELELKSYTRKIRELNQNNIKNLSKQKIMEIKTEIKYLNHFQIQVNENQEKMMELDNLNSYLKSIYVYILNT